MEEATSPPSSAPISTGTVSIENDPRVLAAGVVHALYRLIKGCFLHDDSNQALVPLVESVIDAANQFTTRAHAPHASVLFANNSVFVNRQMLRASRDTYQLALELGALLAPCNVTEVTIEPGVHATEVAEFGRAIAGMHRDKKPNALLSDGGWAHFRVRKVLGFGGGPVLPAVTRVARTYAASIMIVRAFHADLKKGKLELSHALKRVAQKISGAPDDEKRLLLSTAATPSSDADRAGVAVSSAIIAVLVASQLSDDRVALTNLAMAALLYDSARIRLARSPDTALRSLNEEEEERLPMSGIVAMTALGKLHPPSIARSVILHEALALRSSTTPPYGGARAPHILSRILVIARSFAELRVARGAAAPLSIDDALDVLNGQATDNTARSLVKLLVGTLGVFPAGTMVELSTGELAVVVSTPRLPIDFARPPVRIMYDANARLLDEPIDVDLAAQAKGSTPRFVKKPIDASDQQMKQMRAYVMSLSRKRVPTGGSPVGSQAERQPEPQAEAKRAPPKRRPTAPQADLSGKSSSVTAAVHEPARSGSASSRPVRLKTQDPRQEDDARAPTTEIMSSRPPPRGRRLDSSLMPAPSLSARPVALPAVSEEERRFLEDVGPPSKSRAAPLSLKDEHDWAALPPLPRAPASAPPSSPRAPLLQGDVGPKWTPTASPPISSIPHSAAAPLSGAPGSRTKVQPFGVRPPPAPATPAMAPPVHGTSTRQVDWDSMLAAKKEERRGSVSGGSDADAILAAYLADVASPQGADAFVEPPASPPGDLGPERDSRGSGNAGLRWDRPSSGGAHASGPPSSGPRTPRSYAPSGGDSSSGGLRWGGQRPRGDEASSSPGRLVTDEEDQPSPPPSAPNSGRAKAGNQAWGAPKRRTK